MQYNYRALTVFDTNQRPNHNPIFKRDTAMTAIDPTTIHACKQCGKPFPKFTARQARFCSEICRNICHGRSAPYSIKACGFCGTEFYGNSTKLYCNEKCRAKARTLKEGGIPKPLDYSVKYYPVIDGKKECSKCGEIKTVDSFRVNKKRNKTDSVCKKCCVIASTIRNKNRTQDQIIKAAITRRLVRRSQRKNGTLKRDRISSCIRDSIKRGYQSKVVQDIAGFSITELKVHIERQFTKGMSWDVFLSGQIHIDHIIPMARFDLSKDEDIKVCWSLPNLRPMWAKENISKGANILTLL